MSKLDKDQVIANFTEAYKAANGKEPVIEAKGGWYSVDGGKNVRLAALEEMTAELAGGKTEAKAEKAAEPKAAAPAEKAAPKKAAAAKAKKAKPAKGGFSVKQYWAEQILERNSGSRLPR